MITCKDNIASYPLFYKLLCMLLLTVVPDPTQHAWIVSGALSAEFFNSSSGRWCRASGDVTTCRLGDEPSTEKQPLWGVGLLLLSVPECRTENRLRLAALSRPPADRCICPAYWQLQTQMRSIIHEEKGLKRENTVCGNRLF